MQKREGYQIECVTFKIVFISSYTYQEQLNLSRKQTLRLSYLIYNCFFFTRKHIYLYSALCLTKISFRYQIS